MKHKTLFLAIALYAVTSFLPLGPGLLLHAQNNALVLDGAYIVLDGGTATTNIYLVVDQSNTAGITRLASGGHINSEGQYNFVKWNSGTSTGNYIFPFGVGGTAADYIPFTFNKTTAASSDVSVSTWATNPQNMPHPAISNVAAVSNMIGIPDSVTSAIDRFWDIQSPSVTADLTFSYRGTENTTTTPTDTFKTQHWNGTAWDPQAGPGNPGLTTGIGTVGPIPGQTTFSPWVLTKVGLNAIITTSQNLVCNNQCTGTATVASIGGTPPYTYLWNPSNAATATATGLCAGTYTILVTDAVNTTSMDTVTLTEPPALTSSVIPTDATCNLQCNGSAIINVSGGTPGYSYSWNTVPVQTTANATGLCAVNYTYTITDLNNCIQTNTVAITQPTALSLTVTSTLAACSSSTGTAIVNASGGTGGFTYNWNPSAQTSQTATGLVAGSYSVIVADANGCTQTQTVSVTSVNTLIVSTTSTQTSCAINDGTATANPSNGTPPYSYAWSNGGTTSHISNLTSQIYSVTVTDANGCTQMQTASVTQVSGPVATATATATNITLGDNTQLTAAGGVSYSWFPSSGLNNTNSANAIATPTVTTDYCVFVTDGNGCTDSACVTIYVEIPCGDLFIPNAFSPNGDNENDVLYVRGNCIKEMNLIIYNRWGEKVFETADPKQGWDGTFKGKMENTAVFVYHMEGTLTGGEKIIRKGNVTLLK